MGRKRRIFTDKFKAKVAVEAIKAIKPLNELASEYQVHPNQISDWKKQRLSNAPELFASGKNRQAKTEEGLREYENTDTNRLHGARLDLHEHALLRAGLRIRWRQKVW